MKILISPAKKMKEKNINKIGSVPHFINEAKEISEFLKSLNEEELTKSFKIKGKLLNDTIEVIKKFDINEDLHLAISLYDGIQYKYMDIKSFEDSDIDFLNNHLYIVSALYGCLKPLDLITYYRLEMQSEFKDKAIPNMYKYWGDKLYKFIFKDEEVVLNLLSSEYSKSIKPYLGSNKRLVDVYFYELEDNKLVEKGVYAKMLRGLMTRYIAKNKINDIEGVKKFNELNYEYSEINSDNNKLVFIKKENKLC